MIICALRPDVASAAGFLAHVDAGRWERHEAAELIGGCVEENRVFRCSITSRELLRGCRSPNGRLLEVGLEEYRPDA